MTSTRRRITVPAGATALALGSALLLPAGHAAASSPRGGFVSLKATASDGQGGSVSQEITRAFGLK